MKKILAKIFLALFAFSYIVLSLNSAHAFHNVIGSLTIHAPGNSGSSSGVIDPNQAYGFSIENLKPPIEPLDILSINPTLVHIDANGRRDNGRVDEASCPTLFLQKDRTSLMNLLERMKNEPCTLIKTASPGDRFELFLELSYSCTLPDGRQGTCSDDWTDTIMLTTQIAGPPNPDGESLESVKDCGGNDIYGLINCWLGNFIAILIWITGVGSVVMIIYSGVLFMTSAGDTKKITTAKSALTAAIVGTVIVLLAISIQTFVSSHLTGGSTTDGNDFFDSLNSATAPSIGTDGGFTPTPAPATPTPPVTPPATPPATPLTDEQKCTSACTSLGGGTIKNAVPGCSAGENDVTSVTGIVMKVCCCRGLTEGPILGP